MTNRRTPPAAHMAAYTFVQLLFRLGVRVRPGFTPAAVECTRCGGNHSLSRCPWPVMQQGIRE